MQTHIGTKMVKLQPMTRADYNTYRGWALPADENGADEGYLVEYTDGGAPNDPRHAGYISWSPKAQADAAYQPVEAMSFGHALFALAAGFRVARADWQAAGLYLVMLRPGDVGWINGSAAARLGLDPQPLIAVATADAAPSPGWSAGQADMTATDWRIVSAS